MIRRLLVLGSLALLGGCPSRTTPLSPASTIDEQTALQWALSSDSRYTFDVRTRRGDEEHSAAWTFQVRERRPNDAIISMWRDGDDAGQLTVRPDGRLVGASDVFSDALAQRTVWLQLPRRAVRIGDAWDDPQLVRPFVDLLPVGTAESVVSESRVVGLTERDGEQTAIIDSEASVRLQGRVVIEVEGRAYFDPVLGRLISRELTARFHGSSQADTLFVAVHHTGGLRTRPGGRP